MNQKNKFVQKVYIMSIVMKLDDLNKKIFAKFLYPNAYFQPNNIKK